MDMSADIRRNRVISPDAKMNPESSISEGSTMMDQKLSFQSSLAMTSNNPQQECDSLLLSKYKLGLRNSLEPSMTSSIHLNPLEHFKLMQQNSDLSALENLSAAQIHSATIAPVTHFSSSISSLSSNSLSLCNTGSSQVPLPAIKRGPGRPRKDGTSPIQRKKITGGVPTEQLNKGSEHPTKKIFPGRPRVRARRVAPRTLPSQGISLSHINISSLQGDVLPSSRTPKEQDDVFMQPSEISDNVFSLAVNDALSQGIRLQPTTTVTTPPEPFENTVKYKNKFCSFCNLGPCSNLGQGELSMYDPTPGYSPLKRTSRSRKSSCESDSEFTPEKNVKSAPKKERCNSRVARERMQQSRWADLKPEDRCMDYLGPSDELLMIGFPEDIDVSSLFESTGHTYAHHCCASWSEGVSQTETYALVNVDKAVVFGTSQKCSSCQKFGATVACKMPKCSRIYHYPCAASIGAFQDVKTLTLLCPSHLDQAPTLSGTEAECVVCDTTTNVAQMLFCTSCGHHYHGSCLEPVVNVNTAVRAGWQCPECKICQTCRLCPTTVKNARI